MNENKSEIRKTILDNRKNLTEDEVYNKSRIICSKLIELKEFKESDLIMCYMSFRNEVLTGDFIKKSLELGKRIALPLVNNKGGQRELFIYEIKNLEDEINIGMYGILEPVAEKTRRITEDEIDLVIIPGVAFDIKKHRIGYGAGYYDRFLRNLRPDCIKVGIAFDLQIADKIPAEEHDIVMDTVITESKII